MAYNLVPFSVGPGWPASLSYAQCRRMGQWVWLLISMKSNHKSKNRGGLLDKSRSFSVSRVSNGARSSRRLHD
jgi:hypothetical protein